jgi:hypothetical protein
MSDDPEIEAWLDEARSTDIVEVATRIGARLKRTGGEWVGPCPRCNGTDRFAVNPVEQVFNCRGAVGGDVIKMVEHAGNPSGDTPFFEAVEIIVGRPAPRRESQARPVDPEIVRERQEERKDQDLARAAAEAVKQDKNADRAARILDECIPLAGTHADAYLKRRGIHVPASMAADLRFHRGLDYRGFGDADADQDMLLGKFPCMVAAIRDIAGAIIGIHRTYLDPEQPAKLTPPGDRGRNKAKKVFGSVMGGAIRLGPITRCMAAGEGIETTLSWYQLGVGPDDVGIICAVTRGNLCGGATGGLKHPTGRGAIPNGVPAPDKPGMALPPEVEELILLGDRDADMVTMNAFLLTGARRHREAGRTVTIHTPEPLRGEQKSDWNDVALAMLKRAA